MKRSAVVLVAILMSLTACTGGGDEPSAAAPSASASASASAPVGTDPTARSVDGDVEVWDLTGDPSDASFGIGKAEPRADYGGDEPRAVRFELEGGSIQLDLSDLTFYHEGDIFAFLSRTAEIPPDQLAEGYRDLLEALDVDRASADAFEAELAGAPTDQTGQVTVSYPDEIRLGDWTLAVSAAISPAVGTGVLTVSAGYRPLLVG